MIIVNLALRDRMFSKYTISSVTPRIKKKGLDVDTMGRQIVDYVEANNRLDSHKSAFSGLLFVRDTALICV